jgi:uncharacterized protein YbjT (DUF2867 family)
MYCCQAPPRGSRNPAVPDYDKNSRAQGTNARDGMVAGMSDAANKIVGASGVTEVATRLVGGQPLSAESTRGSEVKRMRLPIVGVFPASSRPGLSCIRALTSWPNRRKCAKIVCIVKNEEDIHKVRAVLGDACVDSITFSFANLGDIEAMTHAFIGCDRVFIASHQSPNYATLGIQACEAAREAGVEHFVLVSFCGADQQATVMTRAFRQVETHIQAKVGLKFTILRTLFFMENLLKMDKELRDESHFYGNWGGCQFAPVSIEDLGRTAAAILSEPLANTAHHGKTYNVTGPDLLTGVKMAEIFSLVLGKRIRYLDLPKDDIATKYKELGVHDWLVNLLVENNEFYKTGAVSFQSTDVATITAGNHTSFERFLRFYKWKFMGFNAPTIALFPGTGKVGSATLEALVLESGYAKIRVIARDEKAKSELEERYKGESRISFAVADYEQLETHQEALRDVDRLILVPPKNLSNFECVDSIILKAQEMGVGHTILLSIEQQLMTTAMGRRFTSWERVLRENSFNVTIVRSSLLMELMFQLYDKRRKEVHHWLGDARFFPLDVRDLGASFATVAREGLLNHAGGSYTITGQQALTVNDMTQIMSMVLGFPIEAYPDISMDGFRAKLAPLSSFHVEEVVQVHQVIMNETNPLGSNELIKLVGRYHPFKSFVEFHKNEFLSS